MAESAPQPEFHLFCPQLPDEPSDCYEALFEWTMLGARRTLSGLMRSLRKRWHDRDTLPSPFVLKEWQESYGWEARVSFYDREARSLRESWEADQWQAEAGEAHRTLLRVSLRLLEKANQIAQLPIVEQRIDRDGRTTIVKPMRVTPSDAMAIVAGVHQILGQIRPRSLPEELMESLGVYLKGMESGVLSPTQCETIARHLAAMKSELEQA